jgi:hypothetical protein
LGHILHLHFPVVLDFTMRLIRHVTASRRVVFAVSGDLINKITRRFRIPPLFFSRSTAKRYIQPEK